MITVIGILVGAIIIALVWMCVYFNQEIHDVMAEMRARDGGFYHTPYKVDYSKRYVEVLSEREEYQNKYNSLKKAYDECLVRYSECCKRCAELEQKLLNRDLDEFEVDLSEDDDEVDN